RRQKIFIGIGSVLLLAIMGFELPKMLGGSKEAAGVTTTAVPAASTPGVAPTLAPGKLPNTDRIAVTRSSNQLISFGLFKSKDPFVQQLSTNPTPEAAPPASAPPAGNPATPGGSPASPTPIVPPSETVPSSVPGTPGSTDTTATGTTPGAPATAPTDALLATNGVCEKVTVKGTFPANENIFRLVSVARDRKSVELAVVGGSFDSGQPTAKLELGDKLTLVNTADGTRYEIVLKAACTLATPAQTTGAAATAPASATPVAPAPATTTTDLPATTTTTTTTTTTATTPIVTDSLDTTTPTP